MSNHEHDLGLAHDLPILLSRRRAITLLGGAGLSAALAACGGSGRPVQSATTASAPTTASDSSQEIPEETAGPYPADGSNGVNALTQSGIVRSDITHSFGDASGTAEGVPLTIRLRVLDVGAGSAPLEGAAVYLWHCNQSGQYSLYDAAVSDENYLRGVQSAGADGSVTFTSIYPAAYSGRWPHIHFEVYPSLDEATSAGSKLRTSQMALPGGDEPRGVPDRRVYRQPGQPRSDQPRRRPRVQRRLLPPDGQGDRVGLERADGHAHGTRLDR